MRLRILCSALLLGWAGSAFAQEAPKPQFEFALHGFVSGSLFLQDSALSVTQGASTGQQAIYMRPVAQPIGDKPVFGADVRQSRFNFSVKGPAVGAWTPKGILEIDFFGGNTAGNFGYESVSPRLRLAYVELASANTTIWVGQQNDLIFAIAPTTLAHIAFPFGYAAGNIGWRRPALWLFQRMPAGDMKLELALEVGRSAAPIGIVDAYGNSLGEASGLPTVEARASVSSGTTFSAFITGHWNTNDRSGQGVTYPNHDKIDTIAGNIGAKAIVGPLTIAGTGWVGKNAGALLGHIVQFTPYCTAAGVCSIPGTPPAAPPQSGDLHGWGAWGQLGFNVTKEFSAWAFLGTDHPNYKDVAALHLPITQNVTSAGMLQYRDGGVAVGLEFIHFYTKSTGYNLGTPTGTAATTYGFVAANKGNLSGNQLVASCNYYF